MGRRGVLAITIGCAVMAVHLALGAEEAPNWPQFRGPNASGVSPGRGLPVEFGAGKNIVWQTPIPPGNSSPCVWGERVFLTGVEDSRRLVVLCVARDDGRVRWKKVVPAKRLEEVHPRAGSRASPTPATDGQRVYVFFGSVGLVSFDLEGRLVWSHPLGPFTYHLGWGAASSPILYADSVILNCDHDGQSFLLALDGKTGQVKWRTPRPDAPPSYSTPILWEAAGRTELVVAGSGRVTAYEPDTGKEVWHVGLPEAFVATTPVCSAGFSPYPLLIVAAVDRRTVTGDFREAVAAGRTLDYDALFANHDGNRDGKLSREEIPQMSKEMFDRTDADKDGFLTRKEIEEEYRRQQQGEPPLGAPRKGTGNVLLAIRPGGRGDVADTHVAWRVPGVAPYVPSPLCYGGHVYVAKGGGIVSCFDAATGKQLWCERLAGRGSCYASPVAGDGRVYVVSEAGEVTVLAAGAEPKAVGRNALGERCLATPAIVGSRLYFRTDRSLLCVGEPGL
ncbi:MAG: hypothetical protein FJ290_17480 [Planctomycetes bacterium]|nr:hypothetical protein [Planctomycetota bacterium]